ncbi:MAG: AAA family ATPase [Myxococcota bacterium]|nr:AAA family ATPase [Myxococcota bacterium]
MAKARLTKNARDIAVLGRSGYPFVYLVTPEEERAIRLVKEAAAATKRDCLMWSRISGFEKRDELANSEEPLTALKRLGDVAGPAYFVLLDFHQYLSDPLVCRALRELVQACQRKKQTVILIAPSVDLPPELDKESVIIDLSLPTSSELQEVLQSVASSEGVELSSEIVSRAARSALGLTENQSARIFRKVIVTYKGLSEDCLSEIVSEKKAVLRQSDVLEFFELNSSIDEVGGLDELKNWVRSRTAAFNPEARNFGLPPPKGLLLLGVQGCGKSLSAKAVAHLWKFPLLRLDFGAVFSQSKHGAEGSIRRAIKIAESMAPVVLWIDELEKGLGGNENRSEQASHVLGSFISWLSEKTADVFVVATANDVSALPPELLRKGRFDEIFFVDLPNKHERLEVLTVHLRKRGRNPEDFPKLHDLAAYCEQFSGAELEQVVIAALYQAFSEHRELSFEDLLNSAKATIPLYQTFEEQIKHLRDWASTRARSASTDTRMLDMFGGV